MSTFSTYSPGNRHRDHRIVCRAEQHEDVWKAGFAITDSLRRRPVYTADLVERFASHENACTAAYAAARTYIDRVLDGD